MFSSDEIIWVPLQETDIDEVARIAEEIHPTLPERVEVFAEKARLFPHGCFKLECDGNMMGYALSHPWKLYAIPPLNEFLRELPANADCIYLHDVAVLPPARGRGAAGIFIDRITAVARRMHVFHLACVSVYGTDALWSRFGFRIVTFDDISAKLASYGDSAKYMVADAGIRSA